MLETATTQAPGGARRAAGPDTATRPTGTVPRRAVQAEGVDRRTWIALVVLLAGTFMALLDTTIVNVALPTIRESLGASEATLS